MFFLISVICAAAATLLWYWKRNSNMHFEVLALLYWAVALIGTIDLFSNFASENYIEDIEDIQIKTVEQPAYADNTFLYVAVIASGLLIWFFYFILKNPNAFHKSSDSPDAMSISDRISNYFATLRHKSHHKSHHHHHHKHKSSSGSSAKSSQKRSSKSSSAKSSHHHSSSSSSSSSHHHSSSSSSSSSHHHSSSSYSSGSHHHSSGSSSSGSHHHSSGSSSSSSHHHHHHHHHSSEAES